MAEARLIGICISSDGAAQMESVELVEAIAGHGLVGDRYANLSGTFQDGEAIEPDQEVTLIEEEALQAAGREYDLQIAHRDSRRNLLTRGLALNHMVGQEFRVGDVLLKGIRLCEPCGHLEKLTFEGIRASLVHRGGLRAQVIEGGTIRIDDPIS